MRRDADVRSADSIMSIIIKSSVCRRTAEMSAFYSEFQLCSDLHLEFVVLNPQESQSQRRLELSATLLEPVAKILVCPLCVYMYLPVCMYAYVCVFFMVSRGE